MENHIYSPAFFSSISQVTVESARIIVPLTCDLIKPVSVVDVGCGDGTWLKEFQKVGVEQIIGLDGNYITTEILKIDPKDFIPCDLINPPQLEIKFDMAVCLEVAEHLPFSYSRGFVDYLTSLSNVILFSAAVPFQTGENHINLQWQMFWKELFGKKNYFPITSIRTKLWNEEKIPFYYKQNIILYVNKEALSNNESLINEVNLSKASPINVIHPDYYLQIIERCYKNRVDHSFYKSLLFHINRRMRYLKSLIRFKKE